MCTEEILSSCIFEAHQILVHIKMISKHIRVTSTAYFRNAFPRFRNTRSSHHMERILPVSSIIPRNPDPGEKYTSVVPSIDPSKTQDLRSVPAFGPRVRPLQRISNYITAMIIPLINPKRCFLITTSTIYIFIHRIS